MWFQDDPPSKAGDYIKLDALVAVSACPFDINDFNDGQLTPVKVNAD